MKGIKNIGGGKISLLILSVLTLGIIITAHAEETILAKSNFGALTYQSSDNKISIRAKSKEIYIAQNHDGAKLLNSLTSSNAAYSIVGLTTPGNCCPWYHVVVIELTKDTANLYDTKLDTYLNELPTISMKDKAPLIELKGVVNFTSGAAEFSIQNGSISDIKEVNSKPSGKSCTDLYKIFKAECLPRTGASCDDAGLFRYSEIDSLAKKSGATSDDFFNICYEACTSNKLTEYKEFSSKTCKNPQ